MITLAEVAIPEPTWPRHSPPSELTPEHRAQACRISHYWALRWARQARGRVFSNSVSLSSAEYLNMAAEARHNLVRWKGTVPEGVYDPEACEICGSRNRDAEGELLHYEEDCFK